MGVEKDIRYAELRFTVRFIEDCVLPRFKVSAIRGGIGQMLLDEYCIREKLRVEQGNNCEGCDFTDECIVNRIMYAQMDIRPDFMADTGKASVSEGYVFECDDIRESAEPGDEMQINLILFGKNIYYLSQYLSAMYRLGFSGIGKDKARFQVLSVKNSFNEDILVDGNVYKGRYKIRTLQDYVGWRIKNIGPEGEAIQIRFVTPLSVKKQGEVQKSFSFDEFMQALWRRIYIMKCFEGIEAERPRADDEGFHGVKIVSNDCKYTEIPRYSNRKQDKIFLKGITGSAVISTEDCSAEKKQELLRLLAMGELLHVGSNTSFGFGKYRIKREVSKNE